MNLARGIEQRLENLVDGASASVFRGRMHPVTIASRLVRQLEFLAAANEFGTEIPNDLDISMHPSDLDPSLDQGDLEIELAIVVEAEAGDRGWLLAGPVDVHIDTNTGVPRGVLQCSGENRAGVLDTWGQLIADDASAIVVLAQNLSLIGRALDCDIRLVNGQVSRHHATIARRGGEVFVTDLGSSNGTYVNGTLLDDQPTQLLPGASLVIGDLPFTFRPVF